MIKRVIFIFSTVFNKRDYHRFGFDIIQKRGYEVEAWDFSPWWRPKYASNYTVSNPINFGAHKILRTKNEIMKFVSTLSVNDIVIDPWGIINDNLFIKKILYNNGIIYGGFLGGFIPSKKKLPNYESGIKKGYETHTSLQKKLYLLAKKTISILLNHLFNPTKEVTVKPSHSFIIICGGDKGNQLINDFANKPTKIIKTHALDYDRYLEEENSNNHDTNLKDNYALFLDEDVPFHPDYLYHNIKPYCDSEKYYSEINRFFIWFEQKSVMPVIIAAHPRADYKKRDNPFDGRKIVIDNTINYVKHAKIIFAHMSTSKNFAILYNKPIVHIDSDNYLTVFREHIWGHSSILGELPINVSNDLDSLTINDKIDRELYKSYKETYIKELDTPEKPVWDIFCDYLDKMNA